MIIYTSAYVEGDKAYAVVNEQIHDLGYGNIEMASVRALIIAIAQHPAQDLYIYTDSDYVMRAIFKNKALFRRQFAWWVLLQALLENNTNNVIFNYWDANLHES